MSHIHPDRTSSAELPVVQRAGADAHCFLLVSEAKGTPGAPGSQRAIPARAPPQPANLHTWIQKAVVLVKVLLRQVRVVFQIRCRFVWELDWSLSPAVLGMNGALCSAGDEWCAPLRSALPCWAVPAPQRSHGTAARRAPASALLICTKPRHTALLIHGANA